MRLLSLDLYTTVQHWCSTRTHHTVDWKLLKCICSWTATPYPSTILHNSSTICTRLLAVYIKLQSNLGESLLDSQRSGACLHSGNYCFASLEVVSNGHQMSTAVEIQQADFHRAHLVPAPRISPPSDTIQLSWTPSDATGTPKLRLIQTFGN